MGFFPPAPVTTSWARKARAIIKRKKARFSEYFPVLRNPDCVPRKECVVDVLFFPPMLESGAALRGGWGKRPLLGFRGFRDSFPRGLGPLGYHLRPAASAHSQPAFFPCWPSPAILPGQWAPGPPPRPRRRWSRVFCSTGQEAASQSGGRWQRWCWEGRLRGLRLVTGCGRE